MAYEIRTQIIIQSPAAKIWQVLTDFPSYPNWNPFIRSISGSLSVGQPLKVEIQPPGQKAMRFKPRLLQAKTMERLAWKGKVLLPGLLDGEHIFELAPTTYQTTHFTHREIFTGIFVGMLIKPNAQSIKQGFEQMNEQLRLKCQQS